MKHFVKCIIIVFINAFVGNINGQNLGGRENSQPSPFDIKPSELSKGAISGDVNLFNGTYNTSYSFGSVSTPSGLNYELQMSYTSNTAGGSDVPFMSGIPYGDGWSLNVPSISVSTDVFSKLNENSNPLNLEFDYDDILAEGIPHWYAPTISIPGVISERFIFKYRDEKDNNKMVFVPAKFDKYVEARFDGIAWEVLADNGMRYVFETVQINIQNSSNQRMDNDDQSESAQCNILKNLVIPKYNVAIWYCDQIYNKNDPAMQGITFEYDKFGTFDYYKEFSQPGVAHAISHTLIPQQLNSEQFLFYVSKDPLTDKSITTAKDIFLKKISAWIENGAEIESIRLNYGTYNIPSLVGNLKVHDNFVSRYDSLYNYKPIFSFGIDATSDESALNVPISIGGGFEGWHRYDHWRSDNPTGLVGNPTVGQLACEKAINSTNPYLFDNLQGGHPTYGFLGNYQYYHRTKISTLNSPPPYLNNLPFNHGFLQSPRIGANYFNSLENDFMPHGELYEIRSLVENDNNGVASFCNFDINLATGSRTLETLAPGDDDEFELSEDKTNYRTENIYSTFNQAIKWNSLATNYQTPTPQMLTSNFFQMPNIPSDYEGFNIEIGPGNEDLDYNYYGFLTGSNPPIPENNFNYYPNIPNAECAYWDYYRYSDGNGSKIIKSIDPIRRNFGIGLGWHMIRKVEQLYTGLITMNGFESKDYERFRTWWNYPTTPTSCYNQIGFEKNWDNQPTRANEDVSLRAVAILRYSKNTYMLCSVDHYKTNGEIGYECADGYKLISHVVLDYISERPYVIDNKANNPLSPNVPQLTAFRNVVLLNSIAEVPVNPSKDVTNNSISTDPKWIKFGYVVLPFDNIYPNEYSTNHPNIRPNGGPMVLNEITDQLGGKCQLEYYAPDVINKSIPAEMNNLFSGTAKVHKLPPLALELVFKVKKKQIFSENATIKEWNYSYTDKVENNNPLLNKEKFQTFLNVGITGYKTTIVHEPLLNGKENYTKYNHYWDARRFGKLNIIEKYNNNNQLLSKDLIEYTADTAYSNGMYREFIDYDSEDTKGDYSPLYQNYLSNYEYKFPMIFDAYGTYYFLESCGNFLQPPTLLDPRDTLSYLTSFFVRKIKETHTDYDGAFDNHILQLASGLPGQFNSQTLTLTPGINSTLIQTTSISQIKEYGYFDANNYGITSSKGFYNFIDNWNTLGSSAPVNFNLAYEPSWELFSTKTYSPEQPDAYLQEDYYYYYDLINAFCGQTPLYYSTVNSFFEDPMNPGRISPCPRFDGIYYVRNYGLRNIYYENRNKSKAKGFPEIAKSIYLIYDANYNVNLSIEKYNNVTKNVATVPTCLIGGVLPPDHTEPSYPNRRINVGTDLSGSFLYRYKAVQASDVIRLDYKACGQFLPYTDYQKNLNEPILRWTIQDVPSKHLAISYSMMAPVFPFDNLVTNEVETYTDFGLVKQQKDEKGLITKYYYQPYTYLHNILPNNDFYGSTELFNFGVPIGKDVGLDLPDVLHTDYSYHPDLSISGIIEPNNNVTNYLFDNFGRLKTIIKNNEIISVFDYHQWDGNLLLSFEDRTHQNYTEATILNDHNSNQAVVTRSYIDPLGRKFGQLSQATTDYLSNTANLNITVFSGLGQYDEWNRISKTYKPFTFYSSNTTNFDISQANSAAATANSSNHIYENDLRSRSLRNFDYDENVHCTISSYAIIDGLKLSQQLGIPTFSNSTEKFYKVTSYDQDRKPMIIFENALGQKVATKQFTQGSNYAVTRYQYLSDGISSIITADNGTSTVLSYNQLGRLFYKYNSNEGKHFYMYNRSGQLVLEQDANGHTSGQNSPGIYRKYSYDDFGRITKQEKLIVRSTLNNYEGPFHDVSIVAGPDINRTLFGCGVNSYIPYYYYNPSASSDWLFFMYDPDNLSHKITDYNELIDDPNPYTEKEYFYNGNSINTSLIPCAQNIVDNYLPTRSNLLGRLSHVLNYSDNATVPSEIKFYSYYEDGKILWEAHQFNAEGITVSNVNNTSTQVNAIRYPSYNLRGNILEEQIDIEAKNSLYKYLYNYDNWGRLSGLSIRPVNDINQFPISKLSEFNYDLASGLINNEKYYGVQYSGTTTVLSGCNPECRTFYYNYDLRNRLTEISNSAWFGYKLFYDGNKPNAIVPGFAVNNSQNYNGNINASEINLKTGTDNVIYTTTDFHEPTYYGYQYDAMNRMTEADASVMNILLPLSPTTPNLTEKTFGDEKFNYDDVGNITQLNRGIRDNSNPPVYSIEQSNYSYTNDKVTSVGPRNYTYDASGNLHHDDFRKILIHQYGRANLPYIEEKTDNQNHIHDIHYIYDINDSRIYKDDMNRSPQTANIKEYYLKDQFGNHVGIFNYISNNWKYFAFANGKRIADLNEGLPTYYIYDHLGNTRVKYNPTFTCSGSGTTTTSGTIFYSLENIEEYYPYGKVLREFIRNNPEKYLTTHHERDVETGLDNRGARYYDSDIGRFLSIDPLAGKYFNLSPYNYVIDNPIMFVDPTGTTIKPINDDAQSILDWAIVSFGMVFQRMIDIDVSNQGEMRSKLRNEKGAALTEAEFKKALRRNGDREWSKSDMKDAYNLYSALTSPDMYELDVAFSSNDNFVKNKSGDRGTRHVEGENNSNNKAFYNFVRRLDLNPKELDDLTGENGYGIIDYEPYDERNPDTGHKGTIILNGTNSDGNDKNPSELRDLLLKAIGNGGK